MNSENDLLSYSCSECNRPVGKDSNYCPDCGADLSKQIAQRSGKVDKIHNAVIFSSLDLKTIWLIILLSIIIFLSLVEIFTDISQIGLIQKTIDGFNINTKETEEIYSLMQTVGLIETLILLTTTTLFLVWKNRAYKNLEALNTPGRQYSSGWAVGAYFVPIFNLYLPFLIMQEIWRGSDPDFTDESPDGKLSWKSAPSNILLPLWWISLLIYSFSGLLVYLMGLNLSTLQRFYDFYMVIMISDIVQMIYATILMLLIISLKKRQELKYQRIQLPEPELQGF